jgi:hypothetical protein
MESWNSSRQQGPQRCFREKVGCDDDDDVENKEVRPRSLLRGWHAVRRWHWHAASLHQPARGPPNTSAQMEGRRPCRCCSLGC